MIPLQLVVLVCVGVICILATLLYVQRQNIPKVSASTKAEVCATLGNNRPATKGHRLEFANTSGQIAFQITHASNSLSKRQGWSANETSFASTVFLEPLLQQATDLLKLPLLAQVASSKTFHVVFKGGGVLMRSKAGDGFRSILVDEHSHRITSHGLLEPVVTSSADVLLAWGCVAVIAQRKYLVDINRKLKGLQTAVARVEGFLLDNQSALLETGSREIQRIADRLRTDPSFLFNNSALQNTVENIRAHASLATHQLIKTIVRRTEALRRESELAGLWTAPTEHVEKPAEDVLSAIHSLSYSLLLEGYCAALLASYVEDDTHWRERLKEALTSMTEAQHTSDSFHTLAREKIQSLDERFRFKQTVVAKRDNLLAALAANFRDSSEALRNTRRVLTGIEDERSLLALSKKDLSLLVTVDKHGKVVATSRPFEA